MTPTSRNVVANFAGKVCTGLLTLGLVPVYVRWMGAESFGLVGLFATVQAVLLVLDLGLSTMLNRELARMTATEGASGEARDLVRTLEIPYWGFAALILLASWPLGVFLAGHWVRPERLSPETVRQAMILLGLGVGSQFPFALYSGGLLGLQRQVLLNGIQVGAAVVRGGGALLILAFVDPGIVSFLKWQVAAGAVQTVLAAAALWSCLPKAESPARFRGDLLRQKWAFAGGVVAVTIVSLILTQADKIILSRTLTLEQFGYYSLAAVAAGAFSVIAGPLFSAVFPRFTQLAAAGDDAGERRLYHKSTQVMAVMILPAAVVMGLFSRELMLLWTGNVATAEQTWRVVALLSIGTALNGLMHIPYAVQLAHGWTRLAFWVNLVSIVVLVPLLVVLSLRWGGPGAALVWALLNAGYVLVALQIMHRRLLPGEQWRWYGADFAMPLAGSLAGAGLVRALCPGLTSVPGMLGAVAGAGILSAALAALAASHVRSMLLGCLKGARAAA